MKKTKIINLGNKTFTYYILLFTISPLWIIWGNKKWYEFKNGLIKHKCIFGEKEKDGYRRCKHTGCNHVTSK